MKVPKQAYDFSPQRGPPTAKDNNGNGNRQPRRGSLFAFTLATMACKRSMDCTCPQCAAAAAEFSVEDLKQFSSSINYDGGEEGEGNTPSEETSSAPTTSRRKPAPAPAPAAAPIPAPKRPTPKPAALPIPEAGKLGAR